MPFFFLPGLAFDPPKQYIPGVAKKGICSRIFSGDYQSRRY
jgi:hypothetical protein